MTESSPSGLVGAQHTMLMTLRMHAQDARSARPILGDRFAADVLDRVVGVVGPDGAIDGNRPVVCVRARLVDEAVRQHLDRHPDAVVLHLGCGLDSRVLRVDPGPGVTWVEVDQPPVMALRRTAYGAHPGHSGHPARAEVVDVAASVTDPGWWGDVPTGRPVLAVAEGVLMYLPPEAVQLVVERVLALARTGGSELTLLADTVAPWVRRVAGWHPAFRTARTGFLSTTDDLRAAVVTSGAGRLHRRTASLPRATVAHTSGASRRLLEAFCAVPALERSMVLHQVGTGRP